MSVVPSDTPKAMSTLRLWRARNGQSRRIQPRSLRVRGPSFTSGRRRRAGVLAAAASSAARRARRARVGPSSGSFDAVEDVVEPGAHGGLGVAQRGRTLGSVTSRRSARRSPSTVARSTQPPLHQGVDGRRDRGLGERQLAGELARPFRAVADHRQQPVLGQVSGGARSVHARSSSRARRARVSTSSSMSEVYRTVRASNLCRKTSECGAGDPLRSAGKPAFTAA